MYNQMEEGTLTRGADGALYLLRPGSCVRVDHRADQAGELEAAGGQAMDTEDGAVFAAHLSAGALADPGDGPASRLLIDPGDSSSSRLLIDPGDSSSSRLLIDPGDGPSSRLLIDPGQGLMN